MAPTPPKIKIPPQPPKPAPTSPSPAPQPAAVTAPPTAAPAPPKTHVAPPVDNAVRAARAQRAAEAARRREARGLAWRDRPLESDFDFKPLGDPDHVVQLEGRPRLDLEDIQVLKIIASDDPVSIPVRFATLAWGTIQVAGNRRGFPSFHTPAPSVIRLDHPGLPSLDDSHVPALLVEVHGGMVSGEIVTVSNQLSMGPPGQGFRRIDKASVSRVMALEDLQNLRIGAVDNELRAGHLTFRVNDLSYDLDGLFPGRGRFELVDERPPLLDAHADVAAKGVLEKSVSIKRDGLGQLSATAELSGTLTPRPGHTLSGVLEATFLRGVFDIRGTLVYKSPTVNGEVTVLVTDVDSAWREVRARLGDKAPPAGATADAPHGLALVGWGSLDFKLSEWLTGDAEVIVDPDGFVTAMGRLTPTKTIQLFGQKSEEYTPFDHDLPTEVGVGATLTVYGSVGPGVLGDIVVDGYFTTYDRPETERPNEFSVRGVLAVPAKAGARLTVRGFAHLGILGFRAGARIEATGSVELQAYATAEPHIGRTRLADGSPGYFIRGRLTAGAGLFLGLTGGLVIETPWPLPDITAVSFGHRRWKIGGATISVHGTYFLGGTQEPTMDYQVAKDFNPSALVSTLLHHRERLTTGEAKSEKQTEHWDEDVTRRELEPARETPTLPAGEEAVDVKIPTLAQQQLPAFTEPEENMPPPGQPALPPPPAAAAPTTPAGTLPPTAPDTPPPTTSPAPPPGQTSPSAPAPTTPPPAVTTPTPTPAPTTPAPSSPAPTKPAPTTPTPTTASQTTSGTRALVERFSMQTVKHTLYLTGDAVPRVWMESLRSPLGQRILAAIATAQGELDTARATGMPVDGRSIEDLETELALLETIRVRANEVEADAFSRSHDLSAGIPRDTPRYERIPHSPHLPSLASEIADYAVMCNRTDLGLAERANRPPPVARPVPIADALVRAELVRFGVGNPQRVIDNLTALPAGPEIERLIVSRMFNNSYNYDEVLSQLQVPSLIASTLACLHEGERIHNGGFAVFFEVKGPGRRGGPDYFDVDVAAISANGVIERALAVKRFRGLDALAGNLADVALQLRNVRAAAERWGVMHVGFGTSAELHSDYIGVVTAFRTRYPGIQVRIFYPDGGSEDF